MTVSKKELLAGVLDRSGILDACRAMRPPGLVVLAYHRVYDMGDEDAFACDPELVSADVATFRWQMEHLRRHWNPVSLTEAVDAAEQGRALPPRSVVVTFDDGHADNHDHAWPVLREFGIPATIFLATEYIGSGTTFWFDRVATLMHRAPAGLHRLERLSLDVGLVDIAARRLACKQALARLKLLPDAARREALAEIEAVLGAGVVARSAPTAALTWDQVRAMATGGVEFGSHTVSHPILSMLPPEQLDHELGSSRARIERETGRPCDLLAYPVGKAYAFNDEVIDAARRHGYRAALSYIDGPEQARLGNRYAIRRVAVERYYSRASFKARMVLPGVFL